MNSYVFVGQRRQDSWMKLRIGVAYGLKLHIGHFLSYGTVGMKAPAF